MVSLIQVFMKKPQIVISTLNVHHVILFRANRAFPTAKQNVIDVLHHIMCFEGDLGRLQEYFLTRNYPKHVIEEAFGKVSSMSMADALKPNSPTKCQDLIPFVC